MGVGTALARPGIRSEVRRTFAGDWVAPDGPSTAPRLSSRAGRMPEEGGSRHGFADISES
jgi:hypothetical protein